MLRSVETFPGRSNNKIRDLDRSQESRVFHESTKAKLETSKIGLIPIKI